MVYYSIGVVTTSGEQWRRNRRFSLSTLKGFVLLYYPNTNTCLYDLKNTWSSHLSYPSYMVKFELVPLYLTVPAHTVNFLHQNHGSNKPPLLYLLYHMLQASNNLVFCWIRVWIGEIWHDGCNWRGSSGSYWKTEAILWQRLAYQPELQYSYIQHTMENCHQSSI